MSKTKDRKYRYVEEKKRREKQYNVYVKEMIAVLKHEQVKENLYINGIKLTKHALERMDDNFGISNVATATRMVKDMLKDSIRIGSVLAYDGRINVLYAFNKTAIFLSPDLKRVVTINRYTDIRYEPVIEMIKDDVTMTRESLIDLHWKLLKEIEEEEKKQIDVLLKIENQVSEANSQYQLLLNIGKGKRDRKERIKMMISEHNLMLKVEGWKLFDLKVKQRHIAKSLVSLL